MADKPSRSSGAANDPAVLDQPVELDVYALWVNAMMAVVTTSHDVPRLELWAQALPTARSGAAIRHWCRAVGLSSGNSLGLARSLRAYVQSRRSGKDPRRFVIMATKEAGDRFWLKVGIGTCGSKITLEAWLSRQEFVTDRDALESLGRALRKQIPNVDDWP